MNPQELAPIITTRRLVEEDWEAFRALRLHALAACPAFMPLIEDRGTRLPLEIEGAWWRRDWTTLLGDNPERQFFGVLAAGQLVGIGQLRRIAPGIGELKSGFVREDHRSRGLWKRLVAIRTEHARRLDYRQVRMGYRIGNAAMARAVAGTGFRALRRERMANKYQDGVYGERVLFALDLAAGPATDPRP